MFCGFVFVYLLIFFGLKNGFLNLIIIFISKYLKKITFISKKMSESLSQNYKRPNIEDDDVLDFSISQIQYQISEKQVKSSYKIGIQNSANGQKQSEIHEPSYQIQDTDKSLQTPIKWTKSQQAQFCKYFAKILYFDTNFYSNKNKYSHRNGVMKAFQKIIKSKTQTQIKSKFQNFKRYVKKHYKTNIIQGMKIQIYQMLFNYIKYDKQCISVIQQIDQNQKKLQLINNQLLKFIKDSQQNLQELKGLSILFKDLGQVGTIGTNSRDDQFIKMGKKMQKQMKGDQSRVSSKKTKNIRKVRKVRLAYQASQRKEIQNIYSGKNALNKQCIQLTQSKIQ